METIVLDIYMHLHTYLNPGLQCNRLLQLVKNKLGNYSPASHPITYPMKEPIHNIYVSKHGKTNQPKNLEYFYSHLKNIYKNRDQGKNMTESSVGNLTYK